ncbi:FMN-binding protein [Micromonospora sp. WMMD882]|uniref:FMN-binding protein n=1 Tax=Micromonospora sp. WMMD882 TaxID=3015151 RepID=UPI00248BDDEE|nr:FMN-binding protein [Micromonospora sp. WMMD882]WBB79826.1 FMN-binding protein [Micromonospora sp. WMMD882]
MRRALLAVTGLAAGTTLLVVLKGAPETTPVAGLAAPERPPVVPAPSGPAPGPTPTGGTGSSRPSPTATPAADERSTPAPTRSARTPTARATTAVPAPKRTTATPKAATRRTVTGPVVGNEYGNVQVQVVVSGTRIVDVKALELPEETAESDRRSASVNSRYSGPDGQAVQRQSASLDTVSGATATSDAYRQSLQAAIDAARG